MNLAQISWPLWLAGLAVIGGLLFLLQRLRVRHREQMVVTTLFWKEAKEQARARTFVERFRHPLAYLLALLVAGLAWLAFGNPKWNDQSGERFTVLLDATQAMNPPERFSRAKQEVLQLAESLPRERTQVLLVGGQTRSLLAPGEERALLQARLEGVTSDAAPASMARTMGLLASAQPADHPQAGHTLVVVGDAPLLAPDLGDNVSWVHVPVSLETGTSEYGLRSLGAAGSASAWNQVDVLIEVEHSGEVEPDLTVRIGEMEWRGAVRRKPLDDGSQFVLENVPADGTLMAVTLQPTGGYLYTEASMRLPKRAPISIYVDPSGEDGALRQLLTADTAFQMVESLQGADVALLWSLDKEVAVPAMRWIPADQQDQAILLQHEEALDSDSVLRQALGEFGLDRIDATEMANSAARPIELGAQLGEHRELRIWRELLDSERFGLVESRAFPLLISRGVRWLAQVPTLHAYVAVGSALPRPIGAQGEAFDTGEVLPTSAGEFAGPDGRSLQASVLQPVPALPWAGIPAQEASALPRSFGSPLQWILLLALLVLLIEWALHAQGRIP